MVLALHIQRGNPTYVAHSIYFFYSTTVLPHRKWKQLTFTAAWWEENFQLLRSCAASLILTRGEFLWYSSDVVPWPFYSPTDSTVVSVFTYAYHTHLRRQTSATATSFIWFSRLTFQHRAGLQNEWRDKCHERIERHVFMLCNTYLGMVLCKHMKKNEGEREIKQTGKMVTKENNMFLNQIVNAQDYMSRSC